MVTLCTQVQDKGVLSVSLRKMISIFICYLDRIKLPHLTVNKVLETPEVSVFAHAKRWIGCRKQFCVHTTSVLLHITEEEWGQSCLVKHNLCVCLLLALWRREESALSDLQVLIVQYLCSSSIAGNAHYALPFLQELRARSVKPPLLLSNPILLRSHLFLS